MNLSKPNKNNNDYVKNVGEFQYEPTAGEVFATWHARNRDAYGNRMAGLPDEKRVTMLFPKFNKSNHHLYLAYLLPLSPKDSTFGRTIEKCEMFGDNIPLYNRHLSA
ncbi:unnamed protein product [Hymenolepis diminuta]|uniref:DUF7083 domain-containing protein n=1 Tax=Hymenolepis diminuta TaxID=6216 RepID=A0A564Z4P4_HYMDI|nr:unnamed protein product [Hymenolepis diminuta]